MTTSAKLSNTTGRSQVDISGSLIARNTLLNLIGHAVPLLIGIFTIPYVVDGLGTERFGLLALSWVVLGHFNLFNLGLGVATTKYVAEALGRGEVDLIPKIVWSAASSQVIMGLIGAIILFGITDLLVERFLNIPTELISEAVTILKIIAVSIPIVLLSTSFRGVLAAAQRFDLINAITIPSSTFTFLLPAVGLYLGFGLPGIVVLILLGRLLTFITFVAIVVRIFPQITTFSVSFSHFLQLFTFGGWVTITSILVPIYVYFDRFLIGSILTLAAVSYYTISYEIATRLYSLTQSLSQVLLPAFSSIKAENDLNTAGTLIARSIKYTVIIPGSIAILIAVYAKDILQIWIGNEFAQESTLPLQILSLSVVFVSIGYILQSFVQGVGRPDIPPKINAIIVPIHIILVWTLVSELGIVGAACAYFLGRSIIVFLLFRSIFNIYQLRPKIIFGNGVKSAAIGFFVLICVTSTLNFISEPFNMGIRLFLIIVFFILFSLATWNYVLDDIDRSVVYKVVDLKKWRNS